MLLLTLYWEHITLYITITMTFLEVMSKVFRKLLLFKVTTDNNCLDPLKLITIMITTVY